MALATGTLTPEQVGEYLRSALESDALDVSVSYGGAHVTVRPEALPRAARLCKTDPRLAFDYFDHMAAVDLREEGFAVVTTLYSVTHRHRVHLHAVATGGREDPHLPTLTEVYRGADWHEREAYDMFGITFDGHPGLLPRILTVENFEGWPLRKEFLLSSREAKPWPGAKEPEERHEEDGPGQSQAVLANAEPLSAEQKDAAAAEVAAEAPQPEDREEAPYDQAVYDQLIAEGKSERVARSRAKAIAMRARRAGGAELTQQDSSGGDTEGAAAAQARTTAGDPAPSSPEGAAEVAAEDQADPSIAFDAAAGAVGGDVAAGAPGDQPGIDQPVGDLEQEARVGTGAPPVPSGSPGIEAEGRHTGALEQSGERPAAATPGMTSTPETPAAREQDETPAQPPESDQAAPGGGAPGSVHADDDVPVRPAPGAEAAPLPEDEVDTERPPGTEETPLVHEDGAEPTQGYGTDAADRQGGSISRPEDDGEGSTHR